MSFFKRKGKTGSSPVAASGGSALSGMAFKSSSGGAKPGTVGGGSARPNWTTSLPPDPKGSNPASLSPPRAGIAFLDARVALIPQKELGYLLQALGERKLRPVLVPSVAKIVASVLKAKGGTGVQNDRAIIEGHFKAALDCVKAPDDVVASLHPAIDLNWLGEQKYGLPDHVEEGMWLALVDGVEERPDEMSVALAGKKGVPPEAIKQTGDRLTVSGEIVNVCRNTHGPHILLTADGAIESAALKDAGGPNLSARTFEMPKESVLGLRSLPDAQRLVGELFDLASKAQAQQSPEISPQEPLDGRDIWQREVKDPTDFYGGCGGWGVADGRRRSHGCPGRAEGGVLGRIIHS